MRTGADDAKGADIVSRQSIRRQGGDHGRAQGGQRRPVEQSDRLADAHVEQHVDPLDDRQPTSRVVGLNTDQLHACGIAGRRRHHQELAATGAGMDAVDVLRP